MKNWTVSLIVTEPKVLVVSSRGIDRLIERGLNKNNFLGWSMFLGSPVWKITATKMNHYLNIDYPYKYGQYRSKIEMLANFPELK